MSSKVLARVTVVLALASLVLSGCMFLPTTRSFWGVKVISARSVEEWDTFYVDADSTNYMIVIEIEYKNLRPNAVQFSPESVVLVNTGTDETGWGETPALHKSGSSTQITDFTEESIMYTLAGGESRADTFVYEFPRGFSDFRLYFPESEAIAITLDQ
jgi:hypothetical protein